MGSVDLESISEVNPVTEMAACLHAVYKYYNKFFPIEEIIEDLKGNTGNEIMIAAALHAVEKRLSARIFTFNLSLFNPPWFKKDERLDKKLSEILKSDANEENKNLAKRYSEFLKSRGKILFEVLNEELLKKFLIRGVPVITTVNGAYLYKTSKSSGNSEDEFTGLAEDDIIVLHEYDGEEQTITVGNPRIHERFSNTRFHAPVDRILNSVLLTSDGIDKVLLVIERGGY